MKIILCLAIAAILTPIRCYSKTVNPWLEDFEQLKVMIAETYPNLETAIKINHLDLVKLNHLTEERLKASHSNAESIQILKEFVASFRDGHLKLKEPSELVPSSIVSVLDQSVSAASACQTLYPVSTKKMDFIFPTPLELGFENVSSYFPARILKNLNKKIGLVRISSFVPGHYPDLCAEEWKRYKSTFKKVCDQNCQDKFKSEVLQNRLLSEFRYSLEKLKAQHIDTLLLDLTDNGGGNDWVGGVMRMITAKPLLCGQFGFIRHPHWSQQFEDRIQALKIKYKSAKSKSSRALITTELTSLEHSLEESKQKCDRTSIWKNSALPTCDLVVKKIVHDCKPEDYYKFKAGAYQGSLLLLVNKNSASASEDLIARHKDSKTATILGERTLGAGCGFYNGGINLALKNSGLTVRMSDCARFLLDGANEVEGIKPDVEIKMSDMSSIDFTNRLINELSVLK